MCAVQLVPVLCDVGWLAEMHFTVWALGVWGSPGGRSRDALGEMSRHRFAQLLHCLHSCFDALGLVDPRKMPLLLFVLVEIRGRGA